MVFHLMKFATVLAAHGEEGTQVALPGAKISHYDDHTNLLSRCPAIASENRSIFTFTLDGLWNEGQQPKRKDVWRVKSFAQDYA